MGEQWAGRMCVHLGLATSLQFGAIELRGSSTYVPT